MIFVKAVLISIKCVSRDTLWNEKSQFGPQNGAETGESRMVLFLGPIQPHWDGAVLVPKFGA